MHDRKTQKRIIVIAHKVITNGTFIEGIALTLNDLLDRRISPFLLSNRLNSSLSNALIDYFPQHSAIYFHNKIIRRARNMTWNNKWRITYSDKLLSILNIMLKNPKKLEMKNSRSDTILKSPNRNVC